MNSPDVGNGMIFPELSPTEKRIMGILCDGIRHRPDEMFCCIGDQEANLPNTLKTYISDLRKKLRKRGFDVLLEKNGRMHYRCVRLINTQE